MKKIDREELKKLQMEIMDNVDCFCREYGIRYSIACGTMLGAIRHGGYIPWDDDIDIYMLREDYSRFEELFPEVYNEHFSLFSLKRSQDSNLAFIKVYDTRTICYELNSKLKNPGVCIDVFPIDDVPDDEKEWQKYNECRRKLILDLRHSGLRLSKINSFVKNCGVLFYGIKYLFTNRRKIAERIEYMAQIHNEKGYKRCFECTLGMNVKHPFRKSLFDELIDIPFEDRLYKGFKNYDEFLTCVFGNYKLLPPPEKRISYHTFDAYWKEETPNP